MTVKSESLFPEEVGLMYRWILGLLGIIQTSLTSEDYVQLLCVIYIYKVEWYVNLIYISISVV